MTLCLVADNGKYWEPYSTYPLSNNWKGLTSGQVTKHTATVVVGNPTLYPKKATLLYAFKDKNGVWRQQESINIEPISPEIPWYRYELSNLLAGTEYSYFFIDEGKTNRSVYGRFKTVPSKCDCSAVRFAVSSCNGFTDFFTGVRYPYTTNTDNLSKMPNEDLDFQIQVGDLCYTDAYLFIKENPFPIPGYEHFMASTSAYRNNAPFQQRLCLSQQEFVQSWVGQSLDAPNIKEQLRSTSMYYINDDHEFFNNYSFRGVIDQYTPEQLQFFVDIFRLPALPGGQKYTQNDILTLWGIPNIPPNVFENGFKVMDTIIPTKKGKTTGPGTTNSQRWYKVSWGPTVDVLVLDMANDRGNGLQIFSPEQWNFITTSLLQSKKPFKFIAGSKCMLNTDTRPIQERYDQTLAFFILRNQTAFGGKYPLDLLKYCAGQDLWGANGDFTNMYVNGFPDNIPGLYKPIPSRDLLLEFIVKNKINGVYFLTGDIHFGSLGHVGPSNIPSTPQNPNGTPIHPITPEGNLWEIICSSAGSPFNAYAQNNILNKPDQDMLFSGTRTNTHTIINADAKNRQLVVEWVTGNDIRQDILYLDKHYNVDKSCIKNKCYDNASQPRYRAVPEKPSVVNILKNVVEENKELLGDDFVLTDEIIENFTLIWNSLSN